MQLATKGSNNTDTEKFGYARPPSSAFATVDPKNGLSIQTPTVAPSPATSSLAVQANNAPKPAQPNLSDLPLVRKASLHRFLEKRKDRLNAKAPYQVTASPLAAAPTKKEESESWLGLGPQVPRPSLSLSSEGTQ
nr:unnamed protein product [Ananas comosus var. bracteatus]